MDTFVSAEYIIANALIALAKEGKDCISFCNLREVGRRFQLYCNENNIHAVIQVYGDCIQRVLFECPEYFDCVESDGTLREPMVHIRNGVSIAALQQRFCGYLPLNVLTPLVSAMPEIVSRCGAES